MKYPEINEKLFQHSYTWESYQDLLQQLMEENKTTGQDQSPSLVEYARINLQRNKRIEKTFQADQGSAEKILQIDRPLLLLMITEGWCGDAAQILAAVYHLSKLNAHLTTRVILRDEHPEVMDHFLTNGGRAIPVILAIEPEIYNVLGKWGPRPALLQELVQGWKNEMTKTEMAEKIHGWYAKDKTVTTQREFSEWLLSSFSEILKQVPSEMMK
ncbi:MAG: thioredoxin family protein [Bacteroidia bacterium]